MSVVEYKHPEDEMQKTEVWSWKECIIISVWFSVFAAISATVLWWFAPELQISSSMPIFGELPFTLTLKQSFSILPFYIAGLVLFWGRMEDKWAFGGFVVMGFIIGAGGTMAGFGLFSVFLSAAGAMIFSGYGAMFHDMVVNIHRSLLGLEDKNTITPVIFSGLISGFTALVSVGLVSWFVGGS